MWVHLYLYLNGREHGKRSVHRVCVARRDSLELSCSAMRVETPNVHVCAACCVLCRSVCDAVYDVCTSGVGRIDHALWCEALARSAEQAAMTTICLS